MVTAPAGYGRNSSAIGAPTFLSAATFEDTRSWIPDTAISHAPGEWHMIIASVGSALMIRWARELEKDMITPAALDAAVLISIWPKTGVFGIGVRR